MTEEVETAPTMNDGASAEGVEKVAETPAATETEATEGKKEKKVNKVDSMESLIEELGDRLLPFAEGEMIDATILAVSGNRIWVDVAGQSLGFIPEKEVTSKTGLKKGDQIMATVISMEDEDGNVVLSMKRADREKFWLEMENGFKTGEPVSIKITDANKGGLIADVGGILGFLPVSQLAPAHYPRVSGGDKDEILNRLRKLIGQEVAVKVINCEKDTNKLIFSEKAVKAQEVKTKIDKFKVGDKVKGKITGIVDFGLFVSIDPEIEALAHISEISWTRVNDLHKLFKVGDEVETSIISVEDGRVSLSLKRLLPDPWVKAASKYKVGDVVEGEVTKITPFGAFVSLDENIDGLVHISELSSDRIVDPGQIVELGKKYKFQIISIEAENHRLGLSMKVDKKEKTETKIEKTKKEETVVAKEKEKSAASVEDGAGVPASAKSGMREKRPKKTKKVDEVVG